MQEPRRGPITRRETDRGGRRDVDDTLARDATDGGRPLAVLVEDDPSALNALCMWLEAEGLAVVPCATFAEARTQLTTRRVSVLLTDVRLAEYNGLHLVQLARTLHPGVQLVVFSGYVDDVLEAEARAAGASWFLKPIDLDALREYLRSDDPAIQQVDGSG